MSLLERREGLAVTAGLTGITLTPLVGVMVLSFRRVIRHSQAIKIANLLFRIALPVYIIGVILYTSYAAVVAAGTATYRTELLLGLMSSLFLASGVILLTSSIYLTALAALYIAMGRTKWWSWLRLDTLLGAGLLFILLIAYWGMNLSDVVEGSSSTYRTWRMRWLLVVIDLTLSVMSLGVVGIALYALPKLKRLNQIPLGKMPVLLVIAAFLWAFTVVYGLATTIKSITDEWEEDEWVANRVIFPLFGPWVTSAVVCLLYLILHSPVWSDPAAIPADGRHGPTQPYYGPQQGNPQMGYQQQPYQPGYAPPHNPSGYPQQPQQYQQPQYPAQGYQHTQSPASSLPVYADGNQNPHVTNVK
ncbi:hypothetical protein QC763_607710 [Podospora pseudopauciseta]|uniref:Uncharacterized protein n=1 Tax=Podospora pseudopauciseta TaxID=2093780 RepID=A0ABR0H637_9PEZI|nr:hypothetical protein QC763_607710 [Podospora pseudopauciseta]